MLPRHSSLGHTDHRPWPVPAGPWIMAMTWRNLLFMHWPIAPDVMRRLVPPPFEVDTFDGSAWLGIVPLMMHDVRGRCSPAIPGVSRFPELNVRTYVRVKDRPGVYFFSLDAHQPLAVAMARRFFHLPYYRAAMCCEPASRGEVYYRSARTHPGSGDARFEARYQPVGTARTAVNGALDHFLTERYRLYTTNCQGELRYGEIHHSPWRLRGADVEIRCNTMTAPLGLKLPNTKPLLYYTEPLDVIAWPLRPE